MTAPHPDHPDHDVWVAEQDDLGAQHARDEVPFDAERRRMRADQFIDDVSDLIDLIRSPQPEEPF